MTSPPTFSIILACFNAAKTIEKCFDSIRLQPREEFQLIVIDGGSEDNTATLIESNKDIIDAWISEPDEGIYDAWNKGLKHAAGEWILFVGADDYLLPHALKTYKDFIIGNDVSGVYYISSKAQIVSAQGERRRVFGWPWEWKVFRNKHVVAHPGSLHHRSLFERFGAYDTSYQIAGDYELLLRPKEKLNARFLNKITVEITEGGMSTGFSVCKETRRARLKNRVVSAAKINTGYIWQVFKSACKQTGQKAGLHLYLRRAHNN